MSGLVALNFIVVILIIFCSSTCSDAVRVINNGLAPPEIVHSPITSKPRCTIRAAPLDLIFVLDSSGSLKNKFQDEVDVIRRIVKHVTIGEDATRVMLVQFSGVQHLEFDFKKFTDRESLLVALDVLRHVSGITRVGGAFEFTWAMMTAERGMRGANVPKILYLLSDGRTHDFPKDSEMAEAMRRAMPNFDIWAYGTGEYVAMSELVKITRDDSKIVTNKDLDRLEGLFDQWHGTEICETQPVCIKGSDKPLDMVLAIDSSESIQPIFRDQIAFAVDRVLKNVHVHPEAVRLGLVTFSGQAFIHFRLNDQRFGNNSAIADYLGTLRPIKGTTSAHLALHAAFEMLTDRSETSQVRQNAGKLVVIITDGRSAKSSSTIALRLRNEGISIIAVSLNYPERTSEIEMTAMTNDTTHVFTQRNIQAFEPIFLNYVGFGCPGVALGPDSTPRVRGATDVSCGPNTVTFTVRTQRPMSGLMYAQQYYDDPRCRLVADGTSRELTITFAEGTCGVLKTPSARFDGYIFNVTVILQFHPLIVTRADQGLDVGCFHAQRILPQEAQRTASKRLLDTQCNYRLHRFSPTDCMALDAKVGESLYHTWECDSPPNYQFLVHDCYASSERKNVQILDSYGCEVDPHFLETPSYVRLGTTAASSTNRGNSLGNASQSDTTVTNSVGGYGYVYQEMSAFKFPGDNNVIFRCKISFCDMFSADRCTQMIPPKCSRRSSVLSANNDALSVFNAATNLNEAVVPKIRRLVQRSIGVGGRTTSTRPEFAFTVDVETRTLNVIENEAIRPPTPVRYCDVRN